MSDSSGDCALRLVCNTARLVFERGLTDLCGGNLSVRAGGRAHMTPTYAAQYFLWSLHPRDLVILEMDGTIVQGEVQRLSRETELHLRIYRAHESIGSVFHLHCVELMALAERSDLMNGPVRRYLNEHNLRLGILETHLDGQTQQHDDQLLELVASMDPTRPTVIVAPRHGIFSTAIDTGSNLACVDGLVCSLRRYRLLRELRAANV